MAAQPPLHIFPPISHVERRREEVDNLIKRSLESRPARPYAREKYAPAARRQASRSRTRTPMSQERQNLNQHEKQHETQVAQSSTVSPSSYYQPQKIAQAPQPQPQPQNAFGEPYQLQMSESLPPQPVQLPPRKDSIPAYHCQSMPMRDSVQPLPPRLDSMQPQFHARSAPRESVQPPDFNPDVIKTDPLPAPPSVPPIITQGLKRSISRTPPAKYRPRRSSSARGHGRLSNSSTLTRTSAADYSAVSSHPSSTFSTILTTIDSPITNPSVYGDLMGASRPPSKFDDSRTQSYVGQQRHTFAPPPSRQTSVIEEAGSLPPPPPPPRNASRQSVRSTVTPVSAAPRDFSSRSSYRPQEHTPERAERGRQLSQDSFTVHGSPVLSRSNTLTENLNSPESFYMSEKPISSNAMEKSIQSMFPRYDHAVSLQQQSYYPQRPAPVVPFATLKHEHKLSSSSGSSVAVSTASSSPLGDISSMKELGTLWNASNGQITTPMSGPFNLKMFKQAVKAKRQSKITFGPTENESFYSLAQAHPSSGGDDEPHEALIFRHHTPENEGEDAPKDDLLPIAHMLLNPPPAPSASQISRHSPELPSSEPASQVTTVTPVLATLHALDHASKSAQAHNLALVDPKAESPAAARLAERAVRAATERESCTLTWIRTCARSGKYELHHPSLGVFTVKVEGDVKAALSSISSSTKSRKHAAISIMNPFANLPAGMANFNNTLSPTALAFGSDSKGVYDKKAEDNLLAKLDFTEEQLHLNGPTIQSLGNLYLLDICVSTVLAVAIAESQRPNDPGLSFAAPPPSLMLAKVKKGRIFSSSGAHSTTATSEPNKKKDPPSTVSLISLVRNSAKKDAGKRTIDWSRANAIMGVEHLTDVDDLPRITRGILSVLGAGFKTALWLLEFGVRISAKMVIGLSRFAEKT